MYVSILDHFLHLNFDLSRSLKVKCDGGIGLPIYDFLLVFNNNRWMASVALREPLQALREPLQAFEI